MEPGTAEWFQTIVDGLPQYLWTSDAVGKATYLDPRLLSLLGIEKDPNPAQSWLDRIHPDDRAETLGNWTQALARGQEFRVEYRLRLADGSERWFATRARPKLGANGRPIQWVGTTYDIQQEIDTRFALKAEQLRLTKMAAASPQMLYSFWSSPDGRATFPYVSPAFEKLFGIPGPVLAESAFPFFMLGNPEDAPAIAASVEISARDLTHWRHEWRVNLPDQGEIWVEAHSAPVREPDGTTTWHGSLANVTDRRRAEDEIRRLNAELEDRVAQRTNELELANRELEAFSYSVSHDLREPLRAINGFSQAVVDDHGDALPAEAHKLLGAVRQGALRMGRLIDDLLAFSRLSRQPLERRPIDAEHLVRDCLREIVGAEGPKAEVMVGTLLPCDADPALARQVFMNLLGNAFKYSRKRATPEIEVQSRKDADGYVVYSVRDNGTGFDMKYAGKLFQVFQRLHRAGEFEGTGVGLAIVHRIVQRHGGRVWVEAAPDAGATFYFTLGEG